MPIYEYRCRSCGATFEARRSMSASDTEVACPDGHLDAARLLSVFASTGRASGPSSAAPAPAGGGCGGGCACAAAAGAR